MRAQIEEYEDFCADLGEEPAQVGLAWLLHQPAVTAPIVGPRTLDQLDGAIGSLQITLDFGALARLDEIFPVQAELLRRPTHGEVFFLNLLGRGVRSSGRRPPGDSGCGGEAREAFASRGFGSRAGLWR
jgi:hypothetical protein